MASKQMDIEDEKKKDKQRTKKYFSFDTGNGTIELNDKQIEAVLSDAKSQLVVAGAGCGKTTMLLAKARYLILSGKAKPNEILILSYTSGTVKDVSEKIKKLVNSEGGKLEGLKAKTFHAFGLNYATKLKPEIYVNLPESEKGVSIRKIMETILCSNDVKTLEIKNLYIQYFLPDFCDKLNEYTFSPDKESDNLDFLERYINLFKSQSKYKNFTEVQNELKKKGTWEDKDQIFFALIEKLYNIYENTLDKKGLIDFNDMITYAINYINDPNCSLAQCEYKYIFVDEYQDITNKRYEFLRALIKKINAKLFCVGDDWQSIYGFNGSDISLFTRFKDFFRNAADNITLNETHRFNKVLSDISKDFIQQNPYQIEKADLIGIDGGEDKPIKVIYYGENDNSVKAMGMAIDHILKSKRENDKILVLGRYKNNGIKKGAICQSCGRIHTRKVGPYGPYFGCPQDRKHPTMDGRYIPADYDLVKKDDRFFIRIDEFKKWRDEKSDILLDKKNPELSKGALTFSTIHKAKGLEADYTIFLNMDRSFPHRKEEDHKIVPLLHHSDDYEFAEERRMFYVALTRCKKMVYLLVPRGENRQSDFFKELMQNNRNGIEELKISDKEQNSNYGDVIFGPYTIQEWCDKLLIDRDGLWNMISIFINEVCSSMPDSVSFSVPNPLFHIENNLNWGESKTQKQAHLNFLALGNTTRNGKYISIYLKLKKVCNEWKIDLLELCYSTPKSNPKIWRNEIQSKCGHVESKIWKRSLCYKAYDEQKIGNLEQYKDEILDTLEEMIEDYKNELGIVKGSN